jgi:hypothetical protein
VNQKPEEDKPKKTTRDSVRERKPGWEVALRVGTKGGTKIIVFGMRSSRKDPAAIFPSRGTLARV